MRVALLEQHPMAWLIAVDGLVVDARALAADLQDEARRRGLIPDADARRSRMTTLVWAPDFAQEAAHRVLRTLSAAGIEPTDAEVVGAGPG